MTTDNAKLTIQYFRFEIPRDYMEYYGLIAQTSFGRKKMRMAGYH